MNQIPNIEEWEKEFDKVLETVDSPENYYLKVKAFIHQELQKARQQERERVNHILDSHIEMARDSLKNAVADQVAPYRHQLGRLLQVKTEIIDILSDNFN